MLFVCAYVVPGIFINTDKLGQLRVGHQAVVDRCRKWLRIGFRIVDRDRDLQVAVTHTAKSLHQLSSARQRAPAESSPPIAHEAPRLDDECVSLPSAGRIAVPPGLGIWPGKRPAVEEQLPNGRA